MPNLASLQLYGGSLSRPVTHVIRPRRRTVSRLPGVTRRRSDTPLTLLLSSAAPPRGARVRSPLAPAGASISRADRCSTPQIGGASLALGAAGPGVANPRGLTASFRGVPVRSSAPASRHAGSSSARCIPGLLSLPSDSASSAPHPQCCGRSNAASWRHRHHPAPPRCVLRALARDRLLSPQSRPTDSST